MSLSLRFFIPPLIYLPPTDGWAALMTKINPATTFFVTTRKWMTGNELTQFGPFVMVTLVLSLLS
jgi:hypothetical protein